MPKRERFKLSVSVFLFLQHEGKLLILKRSNTGWMDGYFSVPAGAIDGGETIQDAVIREAKEEIGVVVKPEQASLAHTMHCFTGEDEWLGQFFITNSWESEPKLNEPEKHSELTWVKFDHLPDNMLPYVRQAIENVVKEVRFSEYRGTI